MRLDHGVPSIIKVNKMGKTCMRWNRIGWRHIVILNKVTLTLMIERWVGGEKKGVLVMIMLRK